jgi:RNA polymerase sigma factor (sigma-70 family)
MSPTWKLTALRSRDIATACWIRFFDADDAVQETLIRAWRAWDQFDRRSSVSTWLYRIATNVCLDELKNRGRRARPIEEGSASSASPSVESLTQRPSAYWIEPILDARIMPVEADPSERAMLRQSVRLAFVAALQHLAPKQRAALVMKDVLGVLRGRGCGDLGDVRRVDQQRPAKGPASSRIRAVRLSIL